MSKGSLLLGGEDMERGWEGGRVREMAGERGRVGGEEFIPPMLTSR